MYGEVLDVNIYGDMDEELRVSSYDWYPPGAKHEKSYFGPDDWHCDCSGSPQLLMYSYENGKNMGEEITSTTAPHL